MSTYIACGDRFMEYGGIVDEISEMRYTQICKTITAVNLSRQMKHLDISQDSQQLY